MCASWRAALAISVLLPCIQVFIATQGAPSAICPFMVCIPLAVAVLVITLLLAHLTGTQSHRYASPNHVRRAISLCFGYAVVSNLAPYTETATPHTPSASPSFHVASTHLSGGPQFSSLLLCH